MNKKILITAFKDTSSEKLVKRLQDCDKLFLENHKEKSVEQLIGRLKDNIYDLIISFGQRPLIKDKIHFESTAKDKKGNKYVTGFDIETALKNRKESLINDFAFYPEQVESAEATVVGSLKNVCYLICHKDADTAEDSLVDVI